MKEEMVRTAIYCEKSVLEMASANLKRANARSRNEFIEQAIKHYAAFLGKEDVGAFLTPSLESVLDGKIGDLENRLAQILFKLAVEVSMMLHVTASGADIPEEDLSRLRAMCVGEVSRLNGKISFEKAYQHQKG